MKKIVIFGIGQFYQKYKKLFNANFEIVALIDNNSDLWGSTIDGVRVYAPSDLNKFVYDRIILMSAKTYEMKYQLIELGVDETAICYIQQIRGELCKGKSEIFQGKGKKLLVYRSRILIITADLNYNGGTMAAVYAAKSLLERNNKVVLAAALGNFNLIEEINREGIDVILRSEIPYVDAGDMSWIKQFDIVIVNVYQMIRCACEISKYKPVLWWLHEPSNKFSNIYKEINEEFKEYVNYIGTSQLNICAVSTNAQKNFEYYYPQIRINKLAYGIPDRRDVEYTRMNKKSVFAIVGGVCNLKGQLIFVKAALQLQRIDGAEFWIIGWIGRDKYSEQVKELAKHSTNIKIMGELTRGEIEAKYSKIDVVVSASLEDSLPIVLTEAMMYGKVLIATDACGTAEYIQDGENGFVCKAGDVDSLSEKMQWVLDNQDKLERIGKNARNIYDKYFTLEKFGERLEQEIEKTIKEYGDKQTV